MKSNLNAKSVSRPAAVQSLSVLNTVKNTAQKLFALRFTFFVYFFTSFSICKNCS